MSRLRDKGLRAALSALIAWLLALGLGLPLLKGFGLEGQMLRFAVCTAGLSGVFSLLRTRKYLFSMSLLLAAAAAGVHYLLGGGWIQSALNAGNAIAMHLRGAGVALPLYGDTIALQLTLYCALLGTALASPDNGLYAPIFIVGSLLCSMWLLGLRGASAYMLPALPALLLLYAWTHARDPEGDTPQGRSMPAIALVAAAALCLAFAKNLMRLFFGSIDDDVMAAGLIYLRITALSFPFIALYNAGAAIFRSVGNSKVSMQVSLLMNGINVVGNAICIFVLKMGVAGVAVPTVVSRCVAAVVILLLAANPEQELCLKWGVICRADGKMIGSILRIGVPNACENSFFQLGRLIVVSMIALFGTVQTSANAVANTLDSMGIIVGQAMGLAMVTVVGQCVGAGDPEQVRHYVKKLMLWSYLSMAVCNVLIIVFVEDLISLYSSLSPETVELTKTLVIIHESCAVALWSASFVLPNALRAANDVRFTMLVGIGSMIAFRILGSWILCVQMGWGAIGVWVAMILDWVCRTAFFVTRMISGKWQSKYIPS